LILFSPKNPLLQKLVDKFSNSRDFTISFVLHVILVAIFGTTVLFQAIQEPPDFEGGDPSNFVSNDAMVTAPPPQDTPAVPTPNINVPPTSNLVKIITRMPRRPRNSPWQRRIFPR
jgi:hypothetical protein